ncbi:MAG: hypothetical protein LBE02_05135 [Spirochaetaceae bacterium]|jgi:hypothetical protein|nr:hypothetical protein [Spirochaetaceae bacterium]
MKTESGLLVVSLYIVLMTSCDPSGNLFLEERLNHTVIFPEGISYAPAAMGHEEHSHIIGIRLSDLDGHFLAEYSREYIDKVRNAYQAHIKNNEIWVFTEKGLFFGTLEIDRKYKFDREKIFAYYRSEEAVRDGTKRFAYVNSNHGSRKREQTRGVFGKQQTSWTSPFFYFKLSGNKLPLGREALDRIEGTWYPDTIHELRGSVKTCRIGLPGGRSLCQ